MASTAKNSRTHNVILAANVSHIAGNQFLKKSNCSTDLRVHHPKIYERIIDKMMCIKYAELCWTSIIYVLDFEPLLYKS